MSMPALVYRTHDAETVRRYIEQNERMAEWRERVVDFARQTFDNETVWIRATPEGERIIGFKSSQGQELPAGWRRDKKNGVVPALRTPEGKANDKLIQELPRFMKSGRGTLRGMPAKEFGDHVLATCGVELIDDRTGLEVTWTIAEVRNVADHWVKVPLSQWHAEREARESEEK